MQYDKWIGKPEIAVRQWLPHSFFFGNLFFPSFKNMIDSLFHDRLFSISVLIKHTEFAALEILDGFIYLGLGIHYEWTIAYNRFIDRLTAQKQ